MTVTQRDLDMMLICSTRYALGRETYLPGLVVELVLQHASKPVLDRIRREVAAWLAEDWHDHPCRSTWERLAP